MPPTAPPVLEIENLSVAYHSGAGVVHAVRRVSFSMGRGETFGLVGESGSGKSSAALTIMNYLPPNARVIDGRVRFQGEDLLGLPPVARRALYGDRIAMVYQEALSALNPCLPVGEQVAEALRVHRGQSRSDALRATADLFARVHLPDPARTLGRYPHQLSGGQQQRVLIAMALSCWPDLLILDEPTTGLDVTTEAGILELIGEIKETLGTAILFISHNLGLIARLADRVGVMYAGEFLEVAPVRALFSAPAHRYTQALLSAVPRLGATDARLVPIRGGLPDLRQVPTGCVFQDRCDLARDECREAVLPWEEAGLGHATRCARWRTARSTSLLPGGAFTREAVGAEGSVLLQVRELHRRYRERRFSLAPPFRRERVTRAVDGISFDIREGETVALVGESGCGKTTVARCVAGLLPPSEGQIFFRGVDLARYGTAYPRQIRQQIQMVFQNIDTSLNPRKTVAEIVERPLVLHGLNGNRRRRTEELLEAVGLGREFLSRRSGELSGGERQRVGLARALATDPALVICDEPVSALDVSVQASILNLLLDLRRRFAISYLLISHDLAVVQYVADRIAVMYLGRFCEVGPRAAVYAPPFHPYTEALLSAVPYPDPDREAGRRRLRLEGPVPSPAAIPGGCRFHTRCPRKLGRICEEVEPPVQKVQGDHVIACHIPVAELLGGGQSLRAVQGPLAGPRAAGGGA